MIEDRTQRISLTVTHFDQLSPIVPKEATIFDALNEIAPVSNKARHVLTLFYPKLCMTAIQTMEANWRYTKLESCISFSFASFGYHSLNFKHSDMNLWTTKSDQNTYYLKRDLSKDCVMTVQEEEIVSEVVLFRCNNSRKNIIPPAEGWIRVDLDREICPHLYFKPSLLAI